MNLFVDPGFNKRIQRIFVSVSIIWLVNLGMAIIICLVSWFFATRTGEPLIKHITYDVISTIKKILIGLAVLEIVAGMFIKKIILRRREYLKTEDEAIFIMHLSKVYAGAHLVPASLAMSISVYGLILALSGAGKDVVFPFFILCFVGLWIFQPRIKELKKMVSEVNTGFGDNT